MVGSVNATVSLINTDFYTYTYGNGTPVTQQDYNHYNFVFPISGTNSGTDVVSNNKYYLDEYSFDARFNMTNLSIGWDEMAIFAADNIVSYKGNETGIRLSMQYNIVRGYSQEYIDNSNTTFHEIDLFNNDNLTHNYHLAKINNTMYFYVDGSYKGSLSYTNSNYLNGIFNIVGVAHRYSDGWNSTGDNMTLGNFVLNKYVSPTFLINTTKDLSSSNISVGYLWDTFFIPFLERNYDRINHKS